MNEVWTRDQDLKFYGVSIGARMTAIRFDSGDVFVHSPIKLTEEIVRDLQAMGTVRWAVAPNKMHHLYVADLKKHFPEVQIFCAPELDKKRSDFKFDGVITNEQSFPWSSEVKHVFIEGAPFYNEVVFFHPKTKTLIVSDLATNFQQTDSLLTKMFLKILGSYGHFGWTKTEKRLFIKDKNAFYRSLDKVLSFDFDRIILAHGEPVLTDGKQMLQKVFAR
ncbi:hypothetical protein AZI87_01765 [Bdellovibrio bacteriovorus]|uniref:DUF4336 domain-containing protein n=1 Tax=Bdellovibrio bacteriovorus TaxID=959 RepID=A0A162GFK3_BDEBC|nr:DUF4336 domain-containing protein [Bdellovibrio bacteriovorus]KYG68023.1 hypothetical protein AZI87_01765 [Bdellovibrio bacteriovorus]